MALVRKVVDPIAGPDPDVTFLAEGPHRVDHLAAAFFVSGG